MNDENSNADINLSPQNEVFFTLAVNLIFILAYPFFIYKYQLYGVYYGVAIGLIFSLITSKYIKDVPSDRSIRSNRSNISDTSDINDIYKKFVGVFYANIVILAISFILLLILIKINYNNSAN
jgi:hypothetical protein